MQEGITADFTDKGSNRERFIRRAAHGISTLLHPFFVPVYALVVMLFTPTLYALLSLPTRLYLLGVVALYTLALPTLSILLLRRFGMLSSLRIDRRQERIIPLLIGTICYLLCALTLVKLPVAQLLHKLMFGAALCELFCLVVTLRWKISLHLTAQGGLIAFFSLMAIAGAGNLLVALIVSILGAGLLASARLWLGCHTGTQILAGFSAGFLLMSLTILLL